jgi:hypothetical protein
MNEAGITGDEVARADEIGTGIAIGSTTMQRG